MKPEVYFDYTHEIIVDQPRLVLCMFMKYGPNNILSINLDLASFSDKESDVDDSIKKLGQLIQLLQAQWETYDWDARIEGGSNYLSVFKDWIDCVLDHAHVS